MAEQKSRIYSLPEITEINNDMYLMLDASDTGARRFNLKTFYDKVDGVQASADAANTAATAAAAAVDSANQAAQQAASAAESASTTVQGLVEDVNEAIEAVGDVTELAVPTMSPTVKGGAKLGTGLEVTDGTLSVNTTASGDGSTAGPILSLSAKGWAEQDTTTGKNLLCISGNVGPSAGGPWTSSLTREGATLSISGEYVTISGTTTAQTDFYIPLAAPMPLTSGTDYTISLDGSVTSGEISIFGYSGKTFNGFLYNATSSKMSSKIVENGGLTMTHIMVRAFNAKTFNMRFRIQLELGSTATAYEPYTGGAPSPSPDYPQEIRVCRGRNLIDWDTVYAGKGSGGVFTGQVSQFNAIRIPVTSEMVGKTVTFSANIAVPSNASNVRVAANVNGALVNGNNISMSTSGISRVTVTPVSTNDRFLISYGSGGGVTITISGPQIELGSTSTPYVPYGYVGMDVHAENLFDWSTIYHRPTNSARVDVVLAYLKKVYAGDTLIASYANNGWLVAYYVLNGNTVYEDSGWLDQNVPYTIKKDAGSDIGLTCMAVIMKSNDTTITDSEMYGLSDSVIQLRHIHATPIPLPSRGWVAGLSDGTCDTLTLDGAGKVTWEKGTGEAVFNGSSDENWAARSTSSTAYKSFTLRNTVMPVVWNRAGIGVFSSWYALYSGDDAYYARKPCFSVDSAGILYVVVPNSVADVAALKSMMATHPLTFLYPLATPVTEERGYVEMPQIPVNASISIPELDDLGMRYCVDTSALELARQWYEKARSEYAEELMELRMTVSELATRVS